MKLSTASAILCTALLASFCNAFPYPDYWDREAFLDQLQQEERVGIDINVPIPIVEDVPCIANCEILHPNAILFVSSDEGKSIRRSPNSTIVNPECNIRSRPSIEISGIIYFVFRCIEQCDNLSISYGNVEYHGIKNQLQPRDPDTEATYSCNDNYTLQGDKIRKCDRNGTWLPRKDPECLPLCPVLSISNGDVDYDVDRPREPDTEAKYSCNENYTLRGNMTRTCGRNGTWSGKDPKCVLQCPELQDIANGAVNYTSREEGATATYSCNGGYILNGTMVRMCGQDGKWSGQEPTCEPEPTASPGDGLNRCPKLNKSDIPNNVPEVRSKLWNHPDRQKLLFTPYYKRRIEGDRFEGSKAHLTCMPVPHDIFGDGWKLLEGTPSEQTCVRRNGELVWTRAGTCVYSYSYTSYG